MPPLTELRIREIIRNELGSLLKSDRYTFEKLIQIMDGRNIQVGLTTGTKIGTATGQKLGFFNATPVVQQTDGASLTNNIATGGTQDVITNYVDLTTYANDASIIRGNLNQLARKLKITVDALRSYGLLS